MSAELLLKEFERLSEAPGAVGKLRRFVLTLAVRGRLVPRRSTSTNAAVWPSAPLREFADIEMGQSPPSEYYNRTGDGIPFYQGKADFGALHPSPRFWCTRPGKVAHKGDILISVRAPVGPTNIAMEECCIGRGLAAIRPRRGVLVEFLLLCLRAYEQELSALGFGSTFIAINKSHLSAFALPAPPIGEQELTVAKTNELMAMADRLEAAQAEREQKRSMLASASVRHPVETHLDTRVEHGEWFLQTLDRAFARPQQLPSLRNALLSLAVRGRLVSQAAGEAAAPSFRISPGTSDRLEMVLPVGWSWARVADVADARLGKMLDKAKNAGREYRYLRNTNVHWFEIRTDNLKSLRMQDSETEKYLLRSGDVLICEGGHGIGRTAVWRSTEAGIAFQKALHRVRPGPHFDPDFFACCMAVYFEAGVLQKQFTGVGIPHLTGNALKRLVFPLPPIGEQRRIVAKVSECALLIAELACRLTRRETESVSVLDAVLDRVLGPA